MREGTKIILGFILAIMVGAFAGYCASDKPTSCKSPK